ncbi:MAG TPA: biotin-dependent carboxyltransferase family protein [Micromonosporaceae bacterium]|nr:biotin-dependent carboxyltransferase family protein [Micromonosporaceae bacterium]
MIEVLRAGPLTTVQDSGRPGWAHLGVPRSGALDQPALVLANRLVGNPDGAAGLESTLTGCAVRVRSARTVAVTGALAAVRVAGRAVEPAVPVPVSAGDVVEVGPARIGVRSYLAFGGGIMVESVLGSRSTDILSGLGPRPLRDGDLLPLGRPGPAPSTLDAVPAALAAVELRLRVRLGPRADLFTAEALARLLAEAYTVTPVSNRVGTRLAGPALTRADAAELPPEGIVLGAVQVPPNGQPLVFLADHPTTGGYPVVAVVDAAGVAALAQARPGATVTFHGPQR